MQPIRGTMVLHLEVHSSIQLWLQLYHDKGGARRPKDHRGRFPPVVVIELAEGCAIQGPQMSVSSLWFTSSMGLDSNILCNSHETQRYRSVGRFEHSAELFPLGFPSDTDLDILTLQGLQVGQPRYYLLHISCGLNPIGKRPSRVLVTEISPKEYLTLEYLVDLKRWLVSEQPDSQSLQLAAYCGSEHPIMLDCCIQSYFQCLLYRHYLGMVFKIYYLWEIEKQLM